MDSQYNATWNYPTHILFGAGRLSELAAMCQQFHIAKPMLVTDPQLATLPMVTNTMKALQQAGLAPILFSDIKSNPTGKHIRRGIQQFRDQACDGVIALGGGSSLDSGKAIALAANQSCDLWDLEDVGDHYLRADEDRIAPVIAIPTTSGTGSEVGRVALIVDEATQSKRFIFHPKMLPSCVICDPELTIGVSTQLTAASGMDALTHNLEALCAPGFHPMADGIAMEGLRLIKQWLPIAVEDGSHLDARANMMAAATMGATAFQKGLGAIHSLSHPVGAIYDVHHGLLNAIFLPYVMVFNRHHVEDKMRRLGIYLGCDTKDFQGVLQWLRDLCQKIGIPDSLSEINVDDARADEIALQALADASTRTNPRTLTEPLLKSLFLSAVRGDLVAVYDL